MITREKMEELNARDWSMNEEQEKATDKILSDVQINGGWSRFFIAIGDDIYKNHNCEYYLKKYYDVIPEAEKYGLIKNLQSDAIMNDSSFLPFVKDIKRLRPSDFDKELREELQKRNHRIDETGNILVFHGSRIAKENPEQSYSWTLNYPTAVFQAFGSTGHRETSHTYAGTININDIIAYTNKRNEFEVIQIDSVSNIYEM